MRLTLLPKADQPRAKLTEKGPRGLTDSELITLVLSKGTKSKNAQEIALEILRYYNNDLHQLCKASMSDLSQFYGIGNAKASMLQACFELGRRISASSAKQGTIVRNSREVYAFMQQHFSHLSHEEFLLLFLNNNNEILHARNLSKGGMTGTVADGRILFKLAFEYRATAIIIGHNHPSGNPSPSQQDILLTKNFLKFGNFIDLPILDHIIYTDFGYFSFADEGLLDKE